MKRLAGVFMLVGLLLSCWLGLSQPAIATPFSGLTLNSSPLVAVEFRNAVDDKLGTEYGKRIDLNNTNVRAFRTFPGMYPTLARKILQYAPFDKVDDVLDMPGLTPEQKGVLEANLGNFTVSEPLDALVEGGDRFNNGVYR